MSMLSYISRRLNRGSGVVTPPPSGETNERLVTSNFCDLSGGVTDSEKTLLLNFTDGLVAYDLYPKFILFNPLIGTDRRFNMMYPINDAGAFGFNYVGSPINHAKGIQWQANQGATIELQANLLSAIPLIGAGCYSQDTNLRYAFISSGGSDLTVGFNDGGKTYVGVGASSAGVTMAATTGLLYGQREDNTTVNSYKDSSMRTTESLAISSFNSTGLLVDGLNNPVVSAYFIHETLSPTERINFSNLMNTLMTGLGRAVV